MTSRMLEPAIGLPPAWLSTKLLKSVNHNLCGLSYYWPTRPIGDAVTIAACYISPEGIVLGADSTNTYGNPGEHHYYNHSQKLFELAEPPETGTLGVVAWGLGGLHVSSHRTLLALLADDLRKNKPKSVQDAAERWSTQFWSAYSDAKCPIAPTIKTCKDLAAKAAYDAAKAASPGMRTADEEKQFNQLRLSLVAGFCIGGYALPDRTPAAYEIIFDPLQAKPSPVQIAGPGWRFWGAPNMIQRLIFGADDELKRYYGASATSRDPEIPLGIVT